MADKLNDVNDIVAMLDSMVESGTGHINVTIDPEAEVGKTVETMGCIDCAKGDLACSVPTLMEGMDDAFADESK
jgi:DNA recombination-dependent growth factor C